MYQCALSNLFEQESIDFPALICMKISFPAGNHSRLNLSASFFAKMWEDTLCQKADRLLMKPIGFNFF